MYIAICDDDIEQLEQTKEKVAGFLNPHTTEIDLFTDGTKLLAAVEKGGYEPSIAILDIQMPDIDGISVAKKLNELCPGCRIIFFTSFLGYATDVYEVNHIYFVLKSQLDVRLKSAFDKVFEDIDRDEFIHFKSEGEQWRLRTEGVIYLERNLRKVKIVCRRRSFITTTKLEEILKEIPEGKFIRCHQSYWVNPAYIRSMTADSFILIDETVIPISRASRKESRDAFFNFIHNRTK